MMTIECIHQKTAVQFETVTKRGNIRWPCCLTWDVLELSEIPSERKEHKTMKTMGETTETALEKQRSTVVHQSRKPTDGVISK